MSMIGEIEKLMQSVGTSANYRIINLGGVNLYIEGIKTVVGFDSNEMQFQLKNQLLTVQGTNIKVKYLDKTTCILTGNIQVVSVK